MIINNILTLFFVILIFSDGWQCWLWHWAEFVRRETRSLSPLLQLHLPNAPLFPPIATLVSEVVTPLVSVRKGWKCQQHTENLAVMRCHISISFLCFPGRTLLYFFSDKDIFPITQQELKSYFTFKSIHKSNWSWDSVWITRKDKWSDLTNWGHYGPKYSTCEFSVSS